MMELTPLAPRDSVLKVTENKVQLIQLIVNDLVGKPEIFNGRYKPIVTGPDPVPVQMHNDIVSPRPDLRSTHEEADTILVHQVSLLGPGKAIVVADDTGVFVVLIHFIFSGDIKASVIKVPTSCEINVIGINATLAKHVDIAPNLLAAHTITDCDTVGAIFGVGKLTIVKLFPLLQLVF